jgi:hypothetical protein
VVSMLRHPVVFSARVVVALVLAAAAGLAGLLAGAPAAAAAGTVYAAVTATGAGSCADPADACTLSAALNQVAPGGVVQLVTPGSSARYVGNWAVGTAGTSASAPVTIEPLPGLSSAPVLDGDGPDAPAGETCSTVSCDGPVLTVPAGEYVALTGITLADADNTTSSGMGGGLLVPGTVTVTRCAFTDNYGLHGGAIDSGDGGGGQVTVTASIFTGNTAQDGGAIDSGDGGGGQVTVTASTFTGNTASNGNGDGGAIDSGDDSGGGSVTITASTFTGNTASFDGGAIDSGDGRGGGSVTITASTFTGNTASDGGAIDSGDDFGGGQVTVTASTLAGDTATDHGGAIDNGDNDGAGPVVAAADVFSGSCDQAGGTWDDAGYNASSDGSCLAGGPGDVDAGSAAALGLGPLAANGGPTQTIMPLKGSPVTGIIPGNTLVSLPGGSQWVCPVTDQRGYYTSPPGSCDAGAVQTLGQAPVKLADSSLTPGFRQAGDQIAYRYRLTNTDNTTLTGITINDPAVPGVACPRSSLAPGKAETCTGSYTVTAADVAAGKVTHTATATATAVSGNVVLSHSSTVTVQALWPVTVTGTYQPPAGAAEGYYLGVSGSTWTLEVAHPATGKVAFTGKITINTGKITGLTPISLGTGDSAHVKGKTLTFGITSGTVNGFRFTTTQATSITCTLNVNGTAATPSRIYLGSTPTPSTSPSPLTFTR